MGLSGKHRKQSNTSSMQKPKEKHSVHWFRKGLRLHDNPALIYALKNATTFRCVFVIDPWFAGLPVELNLNKHSSNVGINKWRFLLQCLEDLDQSLRKLNSRLFVIRGQPADVLPKLFKEWGTNCLTFEKDPEPYGKVRDAHLTEICKELNIEVISVVSHTLYKLEKIIERNGGRAPLTYHQFQAIISEMPGPPKPELTITITTVGKAVTPMNDNDENDKYGVPNLEELGFDITDRLKQPAVWVGGETEALARLNRHLERKAWVASFGRPKMTPQSLLASQTGLSPYLRFGCLSTRLFYYELTDLYKKIKKAVPPLSLHGQLLWREFFYTAATLNPNFDKISGNPICVQINWDSNEMALSKWANGQTGFPWIDSIMVQLREEGWIHHLARHAVACFLTRGDLWLSWESGMKVFEELLLDADWSVNAGMWMWLSCSSFFQQFFHCYCPIKFGRKADPNGDFIRRYLPVLKNYPNRFIHEPWNAPENVQKAAKCIIGRDYPMQMVNHAVASRTNMERMKQVYQQLSKYRATDQRADSGGCALQNLLTSAKQQASAAISNSSPSPTTILSLANSSGNYLCKMSQNAPNQQVLTIHQANAGYHQTHGAHRDDLLRPPPPNMNSSLNNRMHTLQNHSTQIHNELNTMRREDFDERDLSSSYRSRSQHWSSSPAVIHVEPADIKPPPQFSYEYNKYQMDSANSEKFHHQQQQEQQQKQQLQQQQQQQQQQHQQQSQQIYDHFGVYCKAETVENNVEMVGKYEEAEAANTTNSEAIAMKHQQQIEQENTLNMEMNTICNIDDTG